MEKLKQIVFSLKNRLLRKSSHRDYINVSLFESLSPEEKKAYSFKKRVSIVEQAYYHCPFYRKFYDNAGFHPSILTSEEDWDKIPVVEKYMIRQFNKDFFADNIDKTSLYASTTGGSTGEPLVVYKHPKLHYEVMAWRSLRWYGIYPWQNEAIVHRRVPTTTLQKIKNRAMWWPTKRAYLSATFINESKIADFISEIKSKEIQWIVGYCGALEFIADYILKHHIEIRNVKLVWSTSSPLTSIVRKKIEEAFNCNVMDQYGCCELGHIAVQKPGEDCLTVHNDYVWVDIVNGSKKLPAKEIGDICITDLTTSEFPLIKYRLGDRSYLVSDCLDSTDGFQKIAFVKGRTTDMIMLPDGSCIDGSFLTTICDNFSNTISCYQLYQDKDYNITFRVIPKNNDSNAIKDITHIVEELKKMIGPTISLKIEITDYIEDLAGKRKFIISEVALQKQKK